MPEALPSSVSTSCRNMLDTCVYTCHRERWNMDTYVGEAWDVDPKFGEVTLGHVIAIVSICWAGFSNGSQEVVLLNLA